MFSTLGVPNLSDRKNLAEIVAPQLYSQVQVEQQQRLKEAKNINVLLDGWTDISKNNYVAVILKCEVNGIKSYEYIGNLDLSGERHTGENLANAAKDLISPKVESSEVLGIITDSASNMISMKSKFVESFPTSFSLPCVLHVLNLVTQDLLKQDVFKENAKMVIEIASFFNRSYYFTECFQNWGKAKQVQGKIITFSATRWFGITDTCRSILKYEGAFTDLFGTNSIGCENMKRLPKNIKAIIQDETFFINIKGILSLIEPLTKTIKTLESDEASVFDVFPAIWELVQCYKLNLISAPFAKRGNYEKILTILSGRSVVFDQDLFIISFYLNPNYRNIASSKKYSHGQIRLKILVLLKKWGYPKNFVSEALDQLELYQNGIRPYNKGSVRYRSFWTNVKESSLKVLALKLMSIVPHAAKCERLFSEMSFMKTKYKNSMDLNTLTAYTQIKMRFKKKAQETQKECFANEFVEENDENEPVYCEEVEGFNYDFLIESSPSDSSSVSHKFIIEDMFDFHASLFNGNECPLAIAGAAPGENETWDLSDFI